MTATAASLHGYLHQLRDSPLLGLLALVGLLAAAWSLRRRSAWAALAFAGCSLLWWGFNGSVEGPTVVHVTRRHGISLADLLPLVLAVAAGIRSRPGRMARPGRT